MRPYTVAALAFCFALAATRAETGTLAETERSNVPQTSPSGTLQARIQEPEASNDMLATLVVERGSEILLRQPLVHAMTSDFKALWSPDESKVAVQTGPFPRHYEVFIFDLNERKVLFSLEGDIATAWQQAALDYFKTRAPNKFASVKGHEILPYPEKWKDNRTLQVSFSLLGWNEGTAALPLGCSASSDAVFEKGIWKLGPFYDYQEEPVTD
jgi:hypothetical protein